MSTLGKSINVNQEAAIRPAQVDDADLVSADAASDQSILLQLDSCYLHENQTTASFTFNLSGRLFHAILSENLDHPDYFESRLVATWRSRDEADSEDSDSTSSVESSFASLRQEVKDHIQKYVLGLQSLVPHSAFIMCTNAKTGALEIYPADNFGINNKFLHHLKSPADLALPAGDHLSWIPFEDLEVIQSLGGSSNLVHLIEYKGSQYCLKALDPVILQSDPDNADAVVKGFYQEISILSTIPPHNHIVPILGIVYLPQTGDLRKIAGFIQPFYSGPTLSEIEDGYTIDDKTAFSVQLVSTLVYLHHTARTFHGDLKLDNIILTTPESKQIILIDFEQLRMNENAQAPEIGGNWDAVINSESKLSYVPHIGSDRVVGPAGWYGEWSAFRSWADIPEALERAEVWSVGSVIEKLFALDSVDEQIAEKSSYPISRIRSLISDCHLSDPLARPLLQEILQSLQETIAHTEG